MRGDDMTAQTPTVLKTYFETGDAPTQAQFTNLIDSYINTVQTSSQQIASDVSALGILNLKGQLNAAASIVVGAPTGGSKGIGTVNATGIYVNGTLITTTSAGGSGTVQAATSGQLAYYTATSNTVGGISVLPNAITVVTRTAGDNSTNPASTAYADNAASTRALATGSAQSTSTGQTYDFVIPLAAPKRVTVDIQDVTTNGSNLVLIQLMTSAAAITTGYSGTAWTGLNGASPFVALLVSGFSVAADTVPGYIRKGILTLENVTGNNWVATGVFSHSDSARFSGTSGTINLGSVLNGVRIRTRDTFSGGTVNTKYQ